MSELQYLTINQAEAKQRNGDSSLYVMNTSNPRGNLNLTIDGANGMRQTISVPITSIPYDITTLAIKTNILQAPEFRRVHAKGWIRIVDTDSAETLFSSNAKARAARDKLFDAVEDTSGLSDIDLMRANATSSEDVSNKLPISTIDPFVMNLVLRSNEGNEDQDTLIHEMSARVDILKIEELRYIVSNSNDASLKEAAAELIELKQ